MAFYREKKSLVYVFLTIFIASLAIFFVARNAPQGNLKCFFVKNENSKTGPGIAQNSTSDPFQEFQDFSNDSGDHIFVSFEEDVTSAEYEVVLNKINDLGGNIIGASKPLQTLQFRIPPCVSETEFAEKIEILPGVQGAGSCLGWCKGEPDTAD